MSKSPPALTLPSSEQMRQVFETQSHELVDHIRVSIKRERNLIYHIEMGAELKVNIEIGPALFARPEVLRERVDRIVTHACEFKRGSRIATGVHHTEPEFVS